jgi:hypothetical protein
VRTSGVLLGLLASALVATTASSGALAPNVRGTFVRSSNVGACFPGEPCDPPPTAAFLLFTRNQHSTRVRLGATGAFAVRLAGGVYRVSVLPGHSSTVSPAMLRVPRVGVIHPRFVERTTSQPVPG